MKQEQNEKKGKWEENVIEQSKAEQSNEVNAQSRAGCVHRLLASK